MDNQKQPVEKNRAWYLGNTTVREAQRLRAGLTALAGSPLEGNLDGRERERAFAISSGITQKRPMRVTSKPANDKTRDIDTGERAYSLRQHEQCLERRKETTSHRTGEPRMAFAADRTSQWGPSLNSRPLPKGSRDRGATTG